MPAATSRLAKRPNGLGTGYVLTMDALLQAWYPARRIRMFNVGTSGHTVRDLKARWQTDVTDLQPDWLSIMVGANDVWRQFDRVTQPERSVPPAEYEQTYDELLTRTAPTLKGGLVLITPFFLELRTDDPMRARMDEYGAIVKRLATKHKAVLVDSQAAFNVVLKDLPVGDDQLGPRPPESHRRGRAGPRRADGRRLRVDVGLAPPSTTGSTCWGGSRRS